MATEPLRIAMWSGPRNISTAMMRAFENRPDTAVIDEPFYAAYLAATGLEHPMRDEVVRSQPSDWRAVARGLVGPAPGGAAVFYQKHMTHHMLADFGLDWIASCRSAFLIRDPRQVVASYLQRRRDITLEDIGVARQAELFAREADRLGRAPPVVDSADVAADPAATLAALCAALGIGFTERMLAWPRGPRPSDGVWAPAWYDQVERSTGFTAPPPAEAPALTGPALAVAEAAAPYYQALARWKITAR